MHIHLSTPKVSPKVTMESETHNRHKMLCWCRFFNCSKHTCLLEDVDNGGDYACVGIGGIWDVVSSA